MDRRPAHVAGQTRIGCSYRNLTSNKEKQQVNFLWRKLLEADLQTSVHLQPRQHDSLLLLVLTLPVRVTNLARLIPAEEKYLA